MSTLTAAQIDNAQSEIFTASTELIETIGKNHLLITPNGDWAVRTWDAATAQCNRDDRGRGNSSCVRRGLHCTECAYGATDPNH